MTASRKRGAAAFDWIALGVAGWTNFMNLDCVGAVAGETIRASRFPEPARAAADSV
jgi:hypothetical protein